MRRLRKGLRNQGRKNRLRGRRDENHKAIVEGLRQYGATVQDLGDVGGGCPDILVGWRGRNYLIEIKRDSKAKLNKTQENWHAGWKGSVYKCHTLGHVLRDINR